MVRRKNQNFTGSANIFIITTSVDEPNAAARKLIRSHVMRGKNTKTVVSSNLKPGAWINRDGAEETLEHVEKVKTASGPRIEFAGSGLCTFRFADGVQPYMADLIFKC